LPAGEGSTHAHVVNLQAVRPFHPYGRERIPQEQMWTVPWTLWEKLPRASLEVPCRGFPHINLGQQARSIIASVESEKCGRYATRNRKIEQTERAICQLYFSFEKEMFGLFCGPRWWAIGQPCSTDCFRVGTADREKSSLWAKSPPWFESGIAVETSGPGFGRARLRP